MLYDLPVINCRRRSVAVYLLWRTTTVQCPFNLLPLLLGNILNTRFLFFLPRSVGQERGVIRRVVKGLLLFSRFNIVFFTFEESIETPNGLPKRLRDG